MKIQDFKNPETDAILTAYISDTIEDIDFTYHRPAVLVIAGGGYYKCSKRESEPIALKFLSKGYNAFVLKYTTPSVFPTPLKEAQWAMSLIRENDEEFLINKEKIAVCGFSAGAHLAAMLATIPEDSRNRPNACVLSYPVIDGGFFFFFFSFDNLLGTDASEEKRRYFSLQNQVSAYTPPTFLWHTADDDTVPVQNSLLFAKALADKNVPFELRIYDSGVHGLSTCEEQTAHYEGHLNEHCSSWFDDALEFLKRHLNLD